jgi:tetratricopeptide (TPR) repeat protein
VRVILLLLSTACVGAGESPDAVSDADLPAIAAEQYQAGLAARNDLKKARPHFREAAAAYERLWERGMHNPELARDMAQAHLLAGNLAGAIRAYQVGLRLAPYDNDLRNGLAYAREQVQYPLTGNLAESCRPREQASLLQLASPDQLRGIAVLLYLLGMAAWARAWMTRRLLWWTTGGVLAAAAMILSCWTLFAEHRFNEGRPALAVVAQNNTPLQRGNSADYPLRINDRLPAGVEMRVFGERGGWLQVELARGEVGWVEKNAVVMVE